MSLLKIFLTDLKSYISAFTVKRKKSSPCCKKKSVVIFYKASIYRMLLYISIIYRLYIAPFLEKEVSIGLEDSKKKINDEQMKLLSFQRILMTIEYLVIRPAIQFLSNYYSR